MSLKYEIVKRTFTGSVYLEVFNSHAEAEAAATIYRKLERSPTVRYEILEGASIGGIPYFADPEIPEGVFVAIP